MSTPRIAFFERYLTLWVLLCIAAGVGLGQLLGDRMALLSSLNVSTVNVPIAILVWAMIFPMMVQIDFGSITQWKPYRRGLALTLTINWLIKPFTMALLAWLFFKVIFAPWIEPETAQDYIAGAILLGAAPCTAMVFVWSYLTRGDANYTLIQVSVNDLVLLVAFIPLVELLLGVNGLSIPFDALLTSVVAFVVIPLLAGWLVYRWLTKTKGADWFKTKFLPTLRPISITALLLTLILLFAYQGEALLKQPLAILLIAVPLTIQTYLIFALGWIGGRWLKLPFNTCAPSAMIGASNFFELAVAVAISLFGLDSGATLTTVVGVLIEVPIMLSLVWIANRKQSSFR